MPNYSNLLSGVNMNLYMKDLISKKYKHLLYKDESPELCDFLLLNYAEVYIYSKTELRVITWSAQKASWIRSNLKISYDWSTDDGLYIFNVPKANLDDLIALGATKQRIYKNGKTLKKLENKLGHRIYPFNPIIRS